jgi:hypothetical protein
MAARNRLTQPSLERPSFALTGFKGDQEECTAISNSRLVSLLTNRSTCNAPAAIESAVVVLPVALSEVELHLSDDEAVSSANLARLFLKKPA